MEKRMLCLDIGGTHISAALITKDNQKLENLRHERSPVDSMADKGTILQQWDAGIQKTLGQDSIALDAIYVSIPGPFDYENGISLMDGMHKYQSILNMDVKTFLCDKYNVAKEHIYFYNDAQAFLLGEVYHFNLYDQKVVGLTLGTGLGSAIYEEHEVKDLNYGSAQFRSGISEDYISTRGMITYINTAYNSQFKEVKELVTSDKYINERKDAFSFLSQALVDFVEDHIISLNPNCIVLGGSISKSHHLFLDQLEKYIQIPIRIASMDEQNLFFGMISYSEAIK